MPNQLPKTSQDYPERAAACERLAEDAIGKETRETMRHLGSHWRVLAAEERAKAKTAAFRQPLTILDRG